MSPCSQPIMDVREPAPIVPDLPSPPSARQPTPWQRRLTALPALMALLVMLVLPVALTGCGGAAQPPRAVVLDALSRQIQLTQGEIARALDLEAAGLPEVSRVRLEAREAIPIGDGKGIKLSGRFDWRLAGDPIRVDSPFELYLQRGERGESWRLARPSGSLDGTLQDWLTYPLALPGDR